METILSLFLNRLKGFYFFPIINFVLCLLILKEGIGFLLILQLLLLIRVSFFKEKMIYLGIGVSFLLSFFVFYIYEKPSLLPVIEEERAVSVEIYPDSIKVDGNLLNATAKELKTGEKVVISYTLQSEKEKIFFSKAKKTIVLSGKGYTQEIEGARNLNGFDYQHYLETKNISQKINLTQLVDYQEIGVSFKHPIKKVKEYRRGFLVMNRERFLPLTSNYMNALLFGYQENGPDNFQKTWQVLGVAHLFSLSGMHIYFFLVVFDYTILSIGITKERLFRLNLVFIWFLIIMTGAGPGMMRAGIQYAVKKLNRHFTFHLSQLDCWSIALFINCLFDPYVLLTVGGQLTYYLTFLILVIYPLIEKSSHPFKKGLQFNLLLSWLSLPLIWYHFYEWNVLNFVLNLFLGPLLLMVIMPILLASFFLGHLFPWLSFNWLEKSLELFQSAANLAASMKSFQFVTGRFPIGLLFLVITSQLLWLIYWDKKGILFSKKGCYCFILSFLIPLWKFINPIGTIAFVDVGQGDAIFVQLPFHQGNYLLDTGGRLDFEVADWQKRSDKRGADYTLIPFMKSMGVGKLDGVFISHAHEDHFGDLDRISDTIKVKTILFGSGSYDQVNFKRMLAYNNLKKSKKQTVNYQNEWQKNGLLLDCLYPLNKGDGQNNDSLVLKLKLKNQSILLMGDLETEGENELMSENPESLSATILKAGHHGSKTSSQPQFLDLVSPEVSIISCGVNNRYQHPSKETLVHLEERGITSYRTDQNGMIYFNWSFLSNYLSEAKTMK